jgi:hypothetical protein
MKNYFTNQAAGITPFFASAKVCSLLKIYLLKFNFNTHSSKN